MGGDFRRGRRRTGSLLVLAFSSDGHIGLTAAAAVAVYRVAETAETVTAAVAGVGSKTTGDGELYISPFAGKVANSPVVAVSNGDTVAAVDVTGRAGPLFFQSVPHRNIDCALGGNGVHCIFIELFQDIIITENREIEREISGGDQTAVDDGNVENKFITVIFEFRQIINICNGYDRNGNICFIFRFENHLITVFFFHFDHFPGILNSLDVHHHIFGNIFTAVDCYQLLDRFMLIRSQGQIVFSFADKIKTDLTVFIGVAREFFIGIVGIGQLDPDT